MKKFIVAVSAIAAFSLLAPTLSNAESEASDSLFAKGARIRFWTPILTSNPNVAEIKEVRSGDFVIVLEDREGRFRLDFEDLERVEVSVGEAKNYTGFFAIIGAVTLGLFSTIFNTAIQDQAETGSGFEAFLGGFLVGGAGGALIGWAVSTGEKWEEVPASYYQVGAGPVDSPGSILAVTFSF
jgi:hypothetical protein